MIANPAARRVNTTLRAAGQGILRRLPLKRLLIPHLVRPSMSANNSASAQPAGRVNAAFRLGPDVLLIPVEDGSARLLDFAGKTFAISDVAARMLSATLAFGPETAAARCARHWGVEIERVQADLETLLTNLVKQGLLVRRDQTSRRPSLSESLAARAVSAFVRVTCFLRPKAVGQARGLLTVANLSCRWLGWPNTVRAWQRSFPLSKRPLQGLSADVALQTIDIAVRQALASSAMHHACKERGLTGWALARRAGLSPRLVIGINLCPLHAHCWAQLGTTYLGDSPERCLQYQPVQIYE
jgi:hypothetical protein